MAQLPDHLVEAMEEFSEVLSRVTGAPYEYVVSEVEQATRAELSKAAEEESSAQSDSHDAETTR